MIGAVQYWMFCLTVRDPQVLPSISFSLFVFPGIFNIIPGRLSLIEHDFTSDETRGHARSKAFGGIF